MLRSEPTTSRGGALGDLSKGLGLLGFRVGGSGFRGLGFRLFGFVWTLK